MALSSCYNFSFKRTSGQLKSKDSRCVMTRATQKKQATAVPTTLKKNYWTSSEHFISVIYVFYFRIGSQSEGITFTIQFFQVQLDWSCQNLSLPIDHLFLIRFHQSIKWLSHVLCTSAWPSLCTSILAFFSIFKLIMFSMLNENFFVTCKVKRWRILEIVAVSLSSSLSLLRAYSAPNPNIFFSLK